jgi:hypothetical protein
MRKRPRRDTKCTTFDKFRVTTHVYPNPIRVSINPYSYRERENVHYENALHIQILIWRNTLIV